MGQLIDKQVVLERPEAVAAKSVVYVTEAGADVGAVEARGGAACFGFGDEVDGVYRGRDANDEDAAEVPVAVVAHCADRLDEDRPRKEGAGDDALGGRAREGFRDWQETEGKIGHGVEPGPV